MIEQGFFQGLLVGTFFTSWVFLFLIFRKDLMKSMGWKDNTKSYRDESEDEDSTP